MYTTQATLKNINLRTEFKGEDERQGAFDLKIEAPLTPELHAFLCKHTEKAVPVKSFAGSGIAEIKYGIELENIVFTIGEHEIKGAKLNKVVGKLGGKLVASMRIQSQIHHKGLIDELNDITGDPMTVTIDELQGDMLDDTDQTAALAPDPESKNIAPEQKAVSKKKTVKKKAAAKKSEGTALHVVGDEGVEMTDEEIAKAEADKKALLARVKTSKPVADSNAGEEISQAMEMLLDLEDKKMGQGDELEYSQLRERLDAGRALNQTQVEQLNTLHNRYAA